MDRRRHGPEEEQRPASYQAARVDVPVHDREVLGRGPTSWSRPDQGPGYHQGGAWAHVWWDPVLTKITGPNCNVLTICMSRVWPPIWVLVFLINDDASVYMSLRSLVEILSTNYIWSPHSSQTLLRATSNPADCTKPTIGRQYGILGQKLHQQPLGIVSATIFAYTWEIGHTMIGNVRPQHFVWRQNELSPRWRKW